jgi:hypothetical protein
MLPGCTRIVRWVAASLILAGLGGLGTPGCGSPPGQAPGDRGPGGDGGGGGDGSGPGGDGAGSDGGGGGDGGGGDAGPRVLLISPNPAVVEVTITDGTVTTTPLATATDSLTGQVINATWSIDRGELGVLSAAGQFTANGRVPAMPSSPPALPGPAAPAC